MDLSEKQKIERIRKTIKSRGAELRQHYPILQYQDLIGLGILVFAISGIIVSASLYLQGHINAWFCVPLIAMFASLLHELEHDLIHWQYFKKQKFLHHLMMTLVWLFRPTTINPWVRRHLHILHLQVSGTSGDIEERGIGNGLAYGPLRFLIMFDTLTGNLIKVVFKGERGKKLNHVVKILLVNFPLPILSALFLYSFLGLCLLEYLMTFFNLSSGWSELSHELVPLHQPWVVIVILPAYLRSLCLNFISSTMHYHGDVKTLTQQTQVLNAWYFWPFQLFCFNFGSTHGIHHFVVNEPFYIRQLTARCAHEMMRQQGVRFNDLATFRRKNRFNRGAEINRHQHNDSQGAKA